MKYKKEHTEWDLERYYYRGIHDPALARDREKVIFLSENFRKKYENIFHTFHTGEDLSQFYSDFSHLQEVLQKLLYYLFYLESVYADDEVIHMAYAEIQQLQGHVSETIDFIETGWQKIGKASILSLRDDPILRDFRFDLEKIIEKLSHFPSEGNARTLQETVKNLEILRGEYLKMTLMPHNAPRESVETKGTPADIYGKILEHIVAIDRMESYDSHIESFSYLQNIHVETLDRLSENIEANHRLFSRYFSLKNLRAGRDEKSVYADFREKKSPFAQQYVSFDTAMSLHLSSLFGKNQKFHAHSEDMYMNGRIDVFPRMHKRTDSFTGYTKNQPSFTLLNYRDSLASATTLAHELGHAFHGYMAQSVHPAVYGTSIFLAEMSAIFSEIIFIEEFGKTFGDEQYVHFLEYHIETILNLIFYQHAIFAFEKDAYCLVRDSMHIDDAVLGTLWRQRRESLFGASGPGEFPAESWQEIHHIFSSSYYTVSYAFGAIVALVLRIRFQEDGMNIYNDILASGGDGFVEDILQSAGIDIREGEMFTEVFSYLSALIERYEAIDTTNL